MLVDVKLGLDGTLFGHACFQQVDDAHLRIVRGVACPDHRCGGDGGQV